LIVVLRFGITVNGKCEDIKNGNPPVNLESLLPDNVFNLATYDMTLPGFADEKYDGMIEALMMYDQVDLNNAALCASVPRDETPIFLVLPNGEALVFDSRVRFQSNTLGEHEYEICIL